VRKGDGTRCPDIFVESFTSRLESILCVSRDDHVYASVWLDDSLVELELCIALDEAENYTTLLSDLWCVAEFLSDNDA
jgi:hypothetical protein